MSEDPSCKSKNSVFDSDLKTKSILDDSLVDELNTIDEQAEAETIMQKACLFQKQKPE